MKKTFSLLFISSLLLIGISFETHADVSRPPSKAKKRYYSGMTVETDSKAEEARLQISSATLKELRVALAELPEDSTATESRVQVTTPNRQRTVLAGISIFLALSFGGVWLVRSTTSRGQKALAALLFGGAILGAAAIMTRANAGPPPAYRWRSLPQNLSQGKITQADVVVEIVPDGEGIKLIVPLRPTEQAR